MENVMHQPVRTRHGEGFAVETAQEGRLVLCMIKTENGWRSRHYAAADVEFLHTAPTGSDETDGDDGGAQADADDDLTTVPAPQTDALRRLWESTADLYREHDVYPPLLSAQKTSVEEAVDALLYPPSYRDKRHMAEAAAAVIGQVIGLLQAAGVEYEAFASAVEKEATDEPDAPLCDCGNAPVAPGLRACEDCAEARKLYPPSLSIRQTYYWRCCRSCR